MSPSIRVGISITNSSSSRGSILSSESMPVEILAMIFAYCLPSDMYVTPRRNEAPLLLTHVCAQWRQLVIAMPLLWSSLSVNVYPTHPEPALPLIYLWLDRSGSCPLSLSLYHDDEGDCENDGSDIASCIFDLFFTFWPRWRNLSVTVPDPCPGYAVTTLPEAGPPLLESLCLRIGDGLCDEEILDSTTLYTSAPKLTEFTWGHSYYDIDHRNVPWAQLSFLRLECHIPMSATLNLTELCPNLITLYLDGVHRFNVRGNSPEPPVRHITHPNLRSLSVTSIQPPDRQTTTTLFSQLTLPNLTRLEIAEVLTAIDPPVSPSRVEVELSAFLLRSKCPLEFLRLDSIDDLLITTIAMISVVSRTLVSLEIQHTRKPANVEPLIALFTINPKAKTPASSLFCPRLEYVKFGSNIEAKRKLIEEMISSRWLAQSSKIPPLKFQSEKPLRRLHP